MLEAEAIPLICALLGGVPEVRHDYEFETGASYVRIDCETDTHAIEIGRDVRSSLDSIQQAEFAAWLAGKEPMVVLIDSDGVEGRIEFRIKTTARTFGVEYRTVDQTWLERVRDSASGSD